MEENYISFRKAKVGGFNKKDVISYIEKMRNDFFDYKKAVETTIDQLNSKIRELETACEMQKETVKEIVVEVPVEVEKKADPLNDINEATSQLLLVADELCRSLSDFMTRITSGEQNVVQTASKPEIFEDVSAYIEETAKEIFEEAPDAKLHKSEDKVAEILNSSVNFSFFADSAEKNMTNTEKNKNEKTILDSLGACSFLG